MNMKPCTEVNYLKSSWFWYLLQLSVTLSLSRDPQQLLFVFLDLLLESNVLLTHDGLQLQQLETNTEHSERASS